MQNKETERKTTEKDARVKKIKALLKRIEREVKTYDAYKEPSWGEIGDLGYVNEQLEIIATFMDA